MIRPVYLYCQAGSRAEEVHEIRPDRMLAPKFPSVQLATSQPRPDE